MCLRLHRREDGTVITSDCTVGVSNLKKSGRAVQKLFAVAIASMLGIFGVSNAFASRQSEATPSQNGAMTLGAPQMMG